MKSCSLKTGLVPAFCGVLFFAISCIEPKPEANLPGYDLNAPVKYDMPQGLLEISGIVLKEGSAKDVYAIQDEDGALFHLSLSDKKLKATKFAGKGDYEDLAICRQQVIILRSDGQLYTFPLSEADKPQSQHTQKWKDLLPEGEYEGLYADDQTGQIFVLTKNSKHDQKHQQNRVFILKLNAAGILEMQGEVNISVAQIEEAAHEKIEKFHPSGFAKSVVTNEWFILSSVNKLLVVTDSSWKVKAAYHLNSNIFNQPEGIAFDRENNLYISNEGGKLSEGNILFFKYSRP
jgi:uncharacterized protein YjiK